MGEKVTQRKKEQCDIGRLRFQQHLSGPIKLMDEYSPHHQQRVKGAPKRAPRAELELKQQFPQVHGQNTDSLAAAFHRDCGNLSALHRCFCLHVYRAAPAVTLARP